MASITFIIGIIVTIYVVLVAIILLIFYRILERSWRIGETYRHLLDAHNIPYEMPN